MIVLNKVTAKQEHDIFRIDILPIALSINECKGCKTRT
jgi:hypothetical protein